MVEYDPVIPNLPIITKAVFSFVRSVPSSDVSGMNVTVKLAAAQINRKIAMERRRPIILLENKHKIYAGISTTPSRKRFRNRSPFRAGVLNMMP
uniref:Uncharacterized protein n=1 Tax=Arion vulgaris TaxID=1028688 RepID=A0A0B6ZL49_9EUPU